MCISEAPLGGMGTDERVSLGMIAVTPSTGDVIWDDFEDGFMRSELEVSRPRIHSEPSLNTYFKTRMAHIKPSELLLPEEKLSKASEKILSHFARYGTNVHLLLGCILLHSRTEVAQVDRVFVIEHVSNATKVK